MFGTPNHLYDCGKIDHRCPFWWISDPAPLLFESVDQQCAIRYAARADKKFQKIDGASFFHPASPHNDEISSFYFFGLGGSMAAPWSEGRFRGSLSSLFRSLNQTNQIDQMNQTDQILATRPEMVPGTFLFSGQDLPALLIH
jgi:hypothetical protein